MTDWAKELAADIVLQAYKDYRRCVKIHNTYPEGSQIRKSTEAEMKSILEFVESSWYEELTNIPREKFIAKLKEGER